MDAKGPLALVALVWFVLVQWVLLVLQFSPSPYVTMVQLTLMGLVSFWLAVGVSPLALRLIVSTALLAWFLNSSSVLNLGHDAWVAILMITAFVSAGLGWIARWCFAWAENWRFRLNWQFRMRELLLMITLCAVALAVVQILIQKGARIASLPDEVWPLVLLQSIFHGVLVGLCGVPVLARCGARLRVFGVILFALVATVALEIATSTHFFQNQIQLGNFPSNASFLWELVLKKKLPAILIVWLTLFPADYALNLFHRPPENSALDA